MGDFRVRQIKDKTERYNMYHYALKDIEAFEQMWRDNAFIKEPIKIGAEQELCVVDENYKPSRSALKLLEAIGDEHYTNELGLYNLEINLDPEIFADNCFAVAEKKLLSFLKKGQIQAERINEKILMCGILPTIDPRHLQFDYMTPIPRYKTLSQMLFNIRGGEFEIYLQGVDDLMASLGSVLFEACNTSFQLHLQIAPDQFVDKYNWAQMISGPVLSACVNSPLIFGRELWAESRIALFKQSLDTRSSKNHLRKKIPRVYFGNDWLKDSPVNLWKNELIRFPLIITSDDLVDSIEVLKNGEVPELRAIRLHNGTTYTWNRLCYGPGKMAHLRIECRYLPAGPSALDEIANFVFWVGLMNAVPENWSNAVEHISFRTVKGNFIKSARDGLNTVFNWFGKNISAKELLLEELLPLSKSGLERYNISKKDIDKYLGVIEQRVIKEQTGSDWMIKNYRMNSKKYKPSIARQELVANMINYQKENIPVHEWEVGRKAVIAKSIKKNQMEYNVEHLMSTEIFSANEDASLAFVQRIFDWKKIHHLPIENHKGELVGVITDGILQKAHTENPQAQYAFDIMLTDIISVQRDTSLSEFQEILKKHSIKGLPVVSKNKLVGMITVNDLKNVAKLSSVQ